MQKENGENGSNGHFHFCTPIREGWKVYREIRAISQDTMVSKRSSRLRHGCNSCWFDFTKERRGGRGYSQATCLRSTFVDTIRLYHERSSSNMIQDLINCLDRNYSKIGCIRNMSIRTILSIYIYLETDVERFLSDISESERCLILSGTLYFRFNTTRVPKMKLASIAKFYDEIHRVNALFITDGSGIYLLQRDLQMYQ